MTTIGFSWWGQSAWWEKPLPTEITVEFFYPGNASRFTRVQGFFTAGEDAIMNEILPPQENNHPDNYLVGAAQSRSVSSLAPRWQEYVRAYAHQVGRQVEEK